MEFHLPMQSNGLALMLIWHLRHNVRCSGSCQSQTSKTSKGRFTDLFWGSKPLKATLFGIDIIAQIHHPPNSTGGFDPQTPTHPFIVTVSPRVPPAGACALFVEDLVDQGSSKALASRSRETPTVSRHLKREHWKTNRLVGAVLSSRINNYIIYCISTCGLPSAILGLSTLNTNLHTFAPTCIVRVQLLLGSSHLLPIHGFILHRRLKNARAGAEGKTKQKSGIKWAAHDTSAKLNDGRCISNKDLDIGVVGRNLVSERLIQ